MQNKYPMLKRPPGYRSGFEERFAAWLKKGEIKFHYEKDKVSFVQPEKHRNYTIDFTIASKYGIIYFETKGRLTLADRQKYEWVKQQYPHLDLRFIFMKDNPILKGSKTKYSDWCKNKGFKYYIGFTDELEVDIQA